MANGNFGGGDGSSTNPLLVEDAYDLNAIRNNVPANKEIVYFKQVQNIDLSIFSNWEPINLDDNSWVEYDGDFYKIINLKINRIIDDVGLFGYSNYLTIHKLVVENAHIVGKDNVGVILGRGSTPDRVLVKFSSVRGNNRVGGICGTSVSLPYESCFEGTVEGNDYVGGLVGEIEAIGGGDSYFKGVVRGNICVGGILGIFEKTNIAEKIYNCYVEGSVYAHDYCGGIVGRMTEFSGGNSGEVRDCYVLLDILQCLGANKDTVVGRDLINHLNNIWSGRVYNCYALNTLNSTDLNPTDAPARIPKATARKRATYEYELTNWIFNQSRDDTYWYIIENNTFPLLAVPAREIIKMKSTPFPLNFRKMRLIE